MDDTVFINRENELEILENAWRNRPGLLVVYGRRRIGKTRLVLEWCRRSKVNCVYYHAIPAKHDVNLVELARVIEGKLGLKGFSRVKYPSLDSLLEMLSYRIDDTVIVIDEFTYWVRAEPRVVGELQRFVDHALGNTRILLVIIGSLMGVMFRSVIGGGAPLYGRAKYKIKLGELEPWHMPCFYPWMNPVDWIRVYSILGGIPYYHILAKENWSIEDILLEFFLKPNAVLRDEVLFILREEFRDPTSYYSILKAIANDASTPSKISDYTGIHRQHVSKYLTVLEQLGFVRREKPLFSKKGVYKIYDKLMNTWFKLIEPVLSGTGYTDPQVLLEKTMSKLDSYVASVFEDEIARKYVYWLAKNKRISFTELGKFIHKGVEIDLVAIDYDNKLVHLFEVKWSTINESEASKITKKLIRASRHLPLEYDYKIHIIAREYVGKPTDNAIIHTLDDMPFKYYRTRNSDH